MVAVVDLFAGAGGFGIAAQRVGCDLRLSIELSKVACSTLEHNAEPGHRVLEGDVIDVEGSALRKLAGLGAKERLIVVGGAPCQPFSKASNWVDEGLDHKWRKSRSAGDATSRPPPPAIRPDSRRTLLDEFSRVVIDSNSDGFVFENVAALLSKRNKPTLDKMRSELEGAGYETVLVKHFASEFGVAQHRERMFLLGSKHGCPKTPVVTHWAKQPQLGLLEPTPVKEVCAPFARMKFQEANEFIKPTETYFSHLNEIDPGRNYKQLTDWAMYPQKTGNVSPFVAERRYWNFLLVLEPTRPSWTIPAVYGSWTGPFHWKKTDRSPRRRLRTTELAAIQGFPAEYKILGTWREKVRQIGNAVPPAMAAAMIKQVVMTVEK